MDLKPLKNHVLVKRVEGEEKTASGIVIPDTAKERPKQGEVVAVGPGKKVGKEQKLVPLSVKKGDRIVFESYAGTEIKIEREDYLILTEDEILAVIER